MEVWYQTGTARDGTGWWIHYEILAPESGAALAHGWTAVFPPGKTPSLVRFGPVGIDGPPRDGLFDCGDATLEFGEGTVRLAGKSGDIAWDLEIDADQEPLYTFPRWAWERQILPGAQLVDLPGSASGSIAVGEEAYDVSGRAAQAHIYSHGSAHQWGWLHCDLGAGNLLEVVTAVPHLPGGIKIPPRPSVRLRYAGSDLPADSFVAALGGRSTAELPKWTATVRLGRRRRLYVAVEQPPERCVQLQYPNPDGSFAYCTNTERADAYIRLDRRENSAWTTEAEWTLDQTAHAEVGLPEPWDQVEVSPAPSIQAPSAR